MTLVGQDIEKAAALLHEGSLVAIPTETVYGLAANALDPIAVAKIFEIKNRPTFDPLIVHTYDLEHLSDFVFEIPEKLKALAQQFMPGPLTILLRKKNLIPDLVTSGLDHVAVRVPDHPLTHSLLERLSFPLAAPSANPFGYISPTTASHVLDQLSGKIPYILDGGRCQVGLESTIVAQKENKEVIVLRKGGISPEEIEQIIGPVEIVKKSTSNPKAPGMLHKHYAPRTPTFLLKDQNFSTSQNKGILCFQHFANGVPKEQQRILSATGSLNEAAYNLFFHLRALDGMNLETIYVELVPETGLGRAINDKLRRAVEVSL